MAYEYLVTFNGKPIDDAFKSHIQNELELFLRKEFLYFRDRAEEIALDNPEAGERCNFGKIAIVFYIYSLPGENNDIVVFDIYDDRNRAVFSFVAGRISGKLISVTLETNSAKRLEDALLELSTD